MGRTGRDHVAFDDREGEEDDVVVRHGARGPLAARHGADQGEGRHHRTERCSARPGRLGSGAGQRGRLRAGGEGSVRGRQGGAGGQGGSPRWSWSRGHEGGQWSALPNPNPQSTGSAAHAAVLPSRPVPQFRCRRVPHLMRTHWLTCTYVLTCSLVMAWGEPSEEAVRNRAWLADVRAPGRHGRGKEAGRGGARASVAESRRTSKFRRATKTIPKVMTSCTARIANTLRMNPSRIAWARACQMHRHVWHTRRSVWRPLRPVAALQRPA